jgi:type IV fimbrial biogenesis protein FimT
VQSIRATIPVSTGNRARQASCRGFTLIELLMVVVILGIMMTLAAPSMSKMIANQRLKSMATDLHLTLVKARGEAIKRNADVTVSPAGGVWSNGWSLVNPDSATEPLDVRGPAASVSVTTSATQVVYRGSGRVTPGSAATFEFTSARTDATRCLSVDPSGRPYLKEGACS